MRMRKCDADRNKWRPQSFQCLLDAKNNEIITCTIACNCRQKRNHHSISSGTKHVYTHTHIHKSQPVNSWFMNEWMPRRLLYWYNWFPQRVWNKRAKNMKLNNITISYLRDLIFVDFCIQSKALDFFDFLRFMHFSIQENRWKYGTWFRSLTYVNNWLYYKDVANPIDIKQNRS